MSDGLSGGFPGAPNDYVWVHNNALPEQQRQNAAFSTTIDEMPGRQQRVSWGVFPLTGSDVLYVRWNGGGGYGDPLDRPPDEVLVDVEEQVTSRAFAHDVYGVVLDDAGQIDEPATDQRRRELRTNRSSGPLAQSA